jgi:hypothetical protein
MARLLGANLGTTRKTRGNRGTRQLQSEIRFSYKERRTIRIVRSGTKEKALDAYIRVVKRKDYRVGSQKRICVYQLFILFYYLRAGRNYLET